MFLKEKKKQKKIIFFGKGTHLKVVVEIASLNNYKIVGIVCDNQGRKKSINKIPILGDRKYLNKVNKKNNHFIVAIGDNETRKDIFNFLKKRKFKFTKLIHPTAVISKKVKIKEGTIIAANVTINTDSIIEENSIINTAAVIEHDVKIGKNTHIAPGVKIGGQSYVGSDSLVGIGSIVRDKIKIGNNVIIGAGSVVVKNCISKGIYVGKPAKKK